MLPIWLLLVAVLVAATLWAVKRARGTARDDTRVDPDRVKR